MRVGEGGRGGRGVGGGRRRIFEVFGAMSLDILFFLLPSLFFVLCLSDSHLFLFFLTFYHFFLIFFYTIISSFSFLFLFFSLSLPLPLASDGA